MVSRTFPRLTSRRDEKVLVPFGPCEVGPGCRYGEMIVVAGVIKSGASPGGARAGGMTGSSTAEDVVESGIL